MAEPAFLTADDSHRPHTIRVGRRIVRFGACAAAFVIAWLLTCLLLRPVYPLSDVPQVKEKLEWLSSSGATYDTLFLGSSRVRRHISPAIFDETMGASGSQTHSFNLGIDAMTFPELDFVLDQALDRVGTELRFVIIDLNQLRRRMIKGSDLNSLREIHWHDWRRTRQAVAAVMHDFQTGEEGLGPTFRLLFTHAVLMTRHYSSTGRGAKTLPLMSPAKKKKAAEALKQTAGFFPEDAELKGANKAAYLKKLKQMTRMQVREEQHDPILTSLLRHCALKIRATGAVPIFLVSPIVQPHRPQLPDVTGPGAPVLIGFDDPVVFPALYLPENRYDAQHLNVAGAEKLTRLLAIEVAELASKRDTPSQ